MKNRNKVVPILINRVFRNGFYAQNKRYVAAVFAVLVATGCSSNDISKHLQGAAAGATQLQGVAAGVMAGAAFGSQVGGAQGVLIGALVGGFIGNQIASRLGEEDKNN